MNSLLTEIIRDAALCHPAKTALLFQEKTYSYLEVWDNVCALAAGMRRQGIQRGDRVVICLGNHPDAIAAFWAVQKLGACPSLLVSDIPVEKLAFILNNSGARLCFATAGVAAALREHGLERVPVLERLICLAAPAGGEMIPVLPMASEEALREASMPLAAISVDLAAIIYTSGSTGEAKGVMLSHQNMVAATRSLAAYLNYRADDTVIAVLPISFDYGLYQMILTFHAGGRLRLEPEGVLPTLVLRHIQNDRCTVVPGIASLYTLLDAYAGKGRFDLASVRMVTNTGMALRKAHVDRVRRLFPRAEIFSMYGLTECKRCTYLPPGDLARKPDSVGIAIPDTQIMVIDDQGRPCAAGEVGQLLVRGATVMQGYWRNPEATAVKIGVHPIHADRCLYTGDYGWIDAEGYFYFAGRMDEVVKVRGRKVVLSEVERALYRHDGILEAAVVVCVAQGEAEARIVAFVVGRRREALSVQDLKRCCAAVLEPHQVPNVFVPMDRLPKNANGKFDKHKLRQGYQAPTKGCA